MVDSLIGYGETMDGSTHKIAGSSDAFPVFTIVARHLVLFVGLSEYVRLRIFIRLVIAMSRCTP